MWKSEMSIRQKQSLLAVGCLANHGNMALKSYVIPDSTLSNTPWL